jgi:hypothetical protein
MSDIRTYENVRHDFAPEEVRNLGEQLAREAQIVYDLRAKKIALTAELTGQIKQGDKRAADLVSKINNGYELREIEVMVMLETPRPGQKTILRADTNETLRVEAMTMQEMQQSFAFREEDK